jgi:signal transduction histidine kinase
MKLLSAFLLLLSVSFSSVAQTDEEQALLDEIVSMEGASPKNEARLTLLAQHSDQGVSVSAQIRLSQLYAQSGRFEQAESVLSTITKDYESYSPKYKTESLLSWASFEMWRNDYVKVEEYAMRAAEVAKASYAELLGNCYYMLGAASNYQKKQVEAKQYLELAYAEYKKNDDARGKFNAANSLGVMFKDNGDLVNGLKYLLEAREAVEEYGSKGHRATVYYNLGDAFLESDEPLKAVDYYQKALALDLSVNSPWNAAYDYRGLASAYLNLEQYTAALQSNEKAVQQLLDVDAPLELSRTYLQQARVLEHFDDPERRLKSLELAKVNAQASSSNYQIMSVNIAKGQYFIDTKQYAAARDLLFIALDAALELSMETNQLEINRLLATTFKALNNFEQAYEHVERAFALQQKLDNEDRREKSERYKFDVNLLEEQLKVNQLEQTEAIQAQVIKDQNVVKQRLIIVLTASAVVFGALALLLIQRRRLALLKARLFEDALEQKQRLFADVSHELRTPLTVLKLQVQALQFHLVSDVEDSYQKLASKVNEINHLISDIYQLAQADTNSLVLNKREVALLPLFERWQVEWKRTVEDSSFEWQCDIDVSEYRYAIDAERIKQVIDNLLSNAVNYTDKPGKIKVSATFSRDKLKVSVEDSAPTVSEDKLEKIFQRLYRMESSRSRQTGGSGLGLAICDSLIQAHGGKIYARQSEMGGLRVTFLV